MSAAAPRIVIDSVSKSFSTPRGERLQVIRDVSLTIRDGEFISIIGPSGCGKTTMLNILAGFEKQDSGSVTLDGKPIDGPGVPGESRLNRHIKPGGQVTADYVAQRMNIEANAQGIISKINCG